jgi:hypothetical protein
MVEVNSILLVRASQMKCLKHGHGVPCVYWSNMKRNGLVLVERLDCFHPAATSNNKKHYASRTFCRNEEDDCLVRLHAMDRWHTDSLGKLSQESVGRGALRTEDGASM